jgi:hypothetical protein
MNNILHVISVDVLGHGVLKIIWGGGYESLVDLLPFIVHDKFFAPLQDPECFKAVRIESYGRSIWWGEGGNEGIDFGCDRLREMAEEQAKSYSNRICDH